MKYGKRIIYDKETGEILNGTFGEMAGDLQEGLRPEKIDYIDLEYGSKILKNAIIYHVDVETKEIVIDKYKEHTETEEEKLIKEKQELENQLLLAENKNLGGIL